MREVKNMDPATKWMNGRLTGRLVVAIPTTGRAEIVVQTIRGFVSQTRMPDLMILSVTCPEDADLTGLENLPFPIRIVTTKKGATRQRNRALKELETDDILVFLDDDFLMAPDYLARVERIFAANPDVAMATGTVLADGIGNQGYTHEQGLGLLTRLDDGKRPEVFNETYNCYGCNMSLRVKPVFENSLRFDEDLPLYSWLEDLDFSRQLARFGRIVKAAELKGVHLGTKGGRTTGVRVGYSQVANPLYLVDKGTMQGWRAQRILWRNVVANLAKSVHPEPWIDRRGRLRGNLLGMIDLVKGKLAPRRILDLN